MAYLQDHNYYLLEKEETVQPQREQEIGYLSPDQKWFILKERSKRTSYENIRKKFSTIYSREAPHRITIWRTCQKETVQTKSKTGPRRTRRTPELMETVKDVLVEQMNNARPQDYIEMRLSHSYSKRKKTI